MIEIWRKLVLDCIEKLNPELGSHINHAAVSLLLRFLNKFDGIEDDEE